MNTEKVKSDESTKEWKKWNETCKDYENKIKETQDKISQKKIELEELQKTTKVLNEKLANVTKEEEEIKKKLNETAEELNKIHKENDELKKQILTLDEELKHLELELAKIKHHINVTNQEANTFKIIAITTASLVGIDALIDGYGHYLLASTEAAYKLLYPYGIGFKKLCESYENLMLVGNHTGKVPKRTPCYTSKSAEPDTSKCLNSTPTITTVTTPDGRRFGAVLFEKWPDVKVNHEVADEKAYAFSSNHAEIAPIKPESAGKAMIVDSFSLIRFGETDIHVLKEKKEV